ncbi:type VI secretion system baseplate subunit TssE [Pseudoduganella sp. S-14]|jgi:type VI secretion system protein ImpF|uniref:type VI secretion system baseplate subunit TssE n=1 Tax=Pseudoduganella sp. S-14 TaxID=3404065 RepID=UPI003CE9D2EF
MSDVPMIPLFERLAGPREPLGDDLWAERDLQKSLLNDLERLLNARNGLTIEQFLQTAPTSLQYGMPDTLRLSPQSTADMALLELVVARALAFYEPRMSQVLVQAGADRGRPVSACVRITAAAVFGRHEERVQFDCVLNGGAAYLAAVA